MMPEHSPFPGEYDYIIVGAGSAGCVVANRLTADPARRVLLLEAGGRDDWIWFHIPVGYLFAISNPRCDWMFTTTPQPGLHGRALAYPRGRVIGGSSAINAMIAMRGQAADYDGWQRLGLDGWGWEDVLPVFRKIEDHFLGPDTTHGQGGEWRVEPARLSWDILDAVRTAATEMGVPLSEDFNTGNNEGAGYFHVNQKAGRRWSAARGFLSPALKRPGLRLETGALTERVLIENGQASGVIFRQNGQRFLARARHEVILCAGAIGSPQILQRSGIGPGAVLLQAGIKPVLDLPGVGSNLQDHLQQRMIFRVRGTRTLNEMYHSLPARIGMGVEYALRRRGPLTMAPSQLGIITRSDPGQERPNIQFHVQPLSLDRFTEPLHRFPAITLAACNLRPTSRGSVRITSPDPDAPPLIDPNYLSTEEDRRIAAEAIHLTRRLMHQPAMTRFRPEEYQPDGPPEDTDAASLAGQVGTTIFHPVGTARMGADNDPMRVVDARLRVAGIGSLRVIDASVMPVITSGNTNTPTIMIAAHAASMI